MACFRRCTAPPQTCHVQGAHYSGVGGRGDARTAWAQSHTVRPPPHTFCACNPSVTCKQWTWLHAVVPAAQHVSAQLTPWSCDMLTFMLQSLLCPHPWSRALPVCSAQGVPAKDQRVLPAFWYHGHCCAAHCALLVWCLSCVLQWL
jgi:hypothetical protein